MPNLGTFVVFASTGGAGAGASTITVPGNADEIVSRAEGSGLALTKVDDNTITVSLPSEVDIADLTAFANALAYAVASPVDHSIGWFTVTARGIVGMADSLDAGLDPDYTSVVGSVTFIPSFIRPIKILSTNHFFAVSPSVAEFDSSGELSFDGGKDIRLISPLWDDLSSSDWTWLAQVRPGPGQSWEGFDVTMKPAPGTTVDLVDFL